MDQIQETNSWITHSKVFGRRISVDLPKELDAQEVQIIIIPTKKKIARSTMNGKKIFSQSLNGIFQKTISG